VHLTQKELEEVAEEFFAQPPVVQRAVLLGLLAGAQELAVTKSSAGTETPTESTNGTTCAGSDRVSSG
jgi:hypothetical protein